MSRAQDGRRWPVLLIGLVVLTATVLGTRQLVLALGSAAPPEPVAGALTTTTPVVVSTTEDGATTPKASTSTTGPLPTGSDGAVTEDKDNVEDETIVEVGDVIIEKPEPLSFPDRVTVFAGEPPGRVTSQDDATPDNESDPDSRTDSGIGAGGASSEVFEEGISDRFTIDVSAEPNGHFAGISIAMNNVPDGLVLRVDFGDGETFEVPPADIERLRGSGTVTVEHRFEPTLTPQPQASRVVAMDEGQLVGSASVAFETQAEFLVGFSPLELTALDDCDVFGKGDFELEWNNDGRERSAKFKLNGGETYVEERFRVGHDGVRYDDDPIEVTLAVHERDPVWVHLLRLPTAYELDHAPEVLPLGVKELATHTYPIAVKFDAGRQCNARFDFTVTYAFADPPR